MVLQTEAHLAAENRHLDWLVSAAQAVLRTDKPDIAVGIVADRVVDTDCKHCDLHIQTTHP